MALLEKMYSVYLKIFSINNCFSEKVECGLKELNSHTIRIKLHLMKIKRLKIIMVEKSKNQ